MDLLVMDTETGGLDPSIHALMEIGIQLYHDGTKVGEFNSRAQVRIGQKRLTLKALMVNGLDPNLGNPPETIADKLALFTTVAVQSKPVILGHNLPFDLGFINEFMRNAGYDEWAESLGRRHMDTKQLALTLYLANKIRVLRGEFRNGLGDLAKIFNIATPAAHTALGDCETTMKVYNALMDLMPDGKYIEVK